MAKFFLRLALAILVIVLTVSITLAVVFYIQRADFEAQLSGKNEQITALQGEKTALQTQLQEVQDLIGQAEVNCFQATESVRLIISNPCSDARLDRDLTVTGMIWGIFENNVEYELIDDSGALVDSGFFTLVADVSEPTLFDHEVELDLPETAGEGTLTFFSSSAMDGSRENEVEIAVTW
jgi:hypothetical protein